MLEINKAKFNESDAFEGGGGNFVRPVGGFKCKIAAIENKADKQGLIVSYDIVDGEFKGYFTKLVKEGRMPKLPSFFKSYKETALGFFKGMLTSIEKSDKTFSIADFEKDYDENKMVGKKIGLVLCEEEYLKGSDVRVATRVHEPHSYKAIEDGEFKVPELKKVSQGASNTVVNNPFAVAPQTPVEKDSGSLFDDDDSFFND